MKHDFLTLSIPTEIYEPALVSRPSTVFCICFATLWMSGVSGPAWAERTGSVSQNVLKDISVEQRQMVTLVMEQPKPGSKQVEIWTDRRDQVYAVGEKVTLFVRVDSNAYITVFNTGTSGKVHQIYPNAYQKSQQVMAGQTLEIPAPGAPFDFVVSGPAGRELVTVVATKEPTSLVGAEQLAGTGPFKSLTKSAGSVVKDMQVVLRREHGTAWSAADVVLKVITH
jgi:hypothetical protein